jgi:ABC-type oligopeptide transport system ATPase subunit
VDGVSFEIRRGEVFGLAVKAVPASPPSAVCLKLYEPTSGEVVFDGIDLETLSAEEMRRLRARMQIVFQDPWRLSTRACRLVRPLIIPGHPHAAFDL